MSFPLLIYIIRSRQRTLRQLPYRKETFELGRPVVIWVTLSICYLLNMMGML